MFKAILRHELSHVIHDDRLHQTLIMYLALSHSNDTVDDVIQNQYPFSQAVETRADVFAACTAADNGANIIIFLKKLKDNPNPKTHPGASERVKLLEKIKAELDAAAAIS
jgi:Zn-dependent protease with chaperone function